MYQSNVTQISPLISFQAKCEEELNSLHRHLQTLDHLHERYVAYQTAFSKLIIEISRRRQYREAAESIVRGMMAQLRSMTEGRRLIHASLLSHYLRMQRRIKYGITLMQSMVHISRRTSAFVLVILPQSGRLCLGKVTPSRCYRRSSLTFSLR